MLGGIMFRAFFLLWLVVFIPFFFMVTPSSYNPATFVSNHASKNWAVSTFNATFHLLNERLVALPENQWLQEFNTINREFGYELKLLPLQQFFKNESKQQQLLNNQYVFETSNNIGVTTLYKRIAGSPWIISLQLEVAMDEILERNSRGSLYLMIARLQQAPSEQWPKILANYQPYFPYSVQVIALSEVSLSTEKLNKLRQQKIVWFEHQDQSVSFYQRIKDSEFVLIAKNVRVNTFTTATFGLIILCIILVVSVVMFLWVYPLWRDLKLLAKTSAEFGDGHLENRAKLGRSSVIASLGLSFNQMADRIQNMIQGQRDLTNAVAHDLRTPLYRLRFAVEMLEHENLNADKKQQYKKTINSSIDDLDHLINQTLLLSRYSRGIDITHFSACNVATKLNEEINHFRLENLVHKVHFEVDATLLERVIVVDYRALLRALNNLLNNATVYAKNTIKISFYLADGHYILSVEDDGPGIPESQWLDIFQPFTQLNNKQRDGSKGHGLGLAIVQQIALWHKGKTTVDQSTLGGAAFLIKWPQQITTQK